MLQVNPSVVYFNGFKAGDVHHHTLVSTAATFPRVKACLLQNYMMQGWV